MATIQFLSTVLILLIFAWKAVRPGSSTCQTNLGVEDRRITDSQLTASTEYPSSVYHGARNARLNRVATGPVATAATTGSWSAATNDLNQWIQAALGTTTWVTGVKIQGRNPDSSGCCQQWVTKFKVQYSNDGVYWKFVQQTNNLGDMIFDGNTDTDTVVTAIFSTPVTASFVRIRPTAWTEHISMRFEVVGCEANICQDPAGVQDGRITDGQLTASSEFAHATIYHGVGNARLNRAAKSGMLGAWAAQTNNINQWIQAELPASTWVTGVMIQGRADGAQWVTKFKVQHSLDGKYWEYVTPTNSQKDQVFDGNVDQHTAVLALFPSPVRASFIRIRPTTWSNHISMRFEVLAC